MRSSTVDRHASKYLVAKAKGGMGNRMLGAITGLLYGRLADRRTVIDWRDNAYANDHSNAFPRFFECSYAVSAAELPEDASVYPAIWRGCLDKSMIDMMKRYDPDKHSSIFIHRKYSVDVRRTDYSQDIVVFWYYTHRLRQLGPRLRSSPWNRSDVSVEGVIRWFLREQMTLHPSIVERMRDFKRARWADKVIGLHIRHTDRQTDLSAYAGALDRILRKAPGAAVFLCTDNRQVSEEYERRYDNIISTAKWFPEQMDAMHENPACPDKYENGVSALVDMFLLAECDYLIYPSVSTFSWIARILSDLPSDRVQDIDQFNVNVRLRRWIRDRVA